MAQRGPKPTPTKVLQLRGSWRAKKRPQEPVPQAEKPPCPAWLAPEQRKVWKQVSGELLTLGILARVDGNALTRYCVMHVTWQRLAMFIREHGETMPVMKQRWIEAHYDSEKTLIPGTHAVYQAGTALRPEVQVWLALADRLLRLEQSFGMSPASRASIGIELARAAMPKSVPPLTGNPRRFLNLDADR